MYRITVNDNDQYNGTVGRAQFAKGVAETDDEATAAYCRRREGYTVERVDVDQDDAGDDAAAAEGETVEVAAGDDRGEASTEPEATAPAAAPPAKRTAAKKTAPAAS